VAFYQIVIRPKSRPIRSDQIWPTFMIIAVFPPLCEHPNQPTSLPTLRKAYMTRYERTGSLEDLDRVISSLQNAVDLIEDSHPERSICSNALGKAYMTRYERTGSHKDFERAISSLHNTVDFIEDAHQTSQFLPTRSEMHIRRDMSAQMALKT
jgi:hypothetical protein